MDVVFTPYNSYGCIKFGASRNEIRSAIGIYKEFKKSPFSKNTTDDFGGFHVYYSDDNYVEAIEVFSGEIKFNDEIMFPTTLSVFTKIMNTFDSEIMKKNDHIISRALGCCASVNEGTIDGIILCSKDYFQRLLNI